MNLQKNPKDKRTEIASIFLENNLFFPNGYWIKHNSYLELYQKNSGNKNILRSTSFN